MYKRIALVALIFLFFHDLKAQEYTATYRVTFVGEWTSQSHPTDYPGGAHFSPLVGHTHNLQGYIWLPGELASEGIEVMAETGGVSTLGSEIAGLQTQNLSETYLLGAFGPGATGMDSIEFEISYSHSLVSLVTMIAPSPDWFVGVHGVDLIDNHFWVEEAMYDLLPYDSGTDSGDTFLSPNQNTSPAQVISRLDENPLPGDVPMGVLLFERLSVTGTSPDVVFDASFD